MKKSKMLTYRGVNLTIDYDYTPAETRVSYYADGGGHPGSAASAEIQSIYIDDQNVTDLLDDMIADIEDELNESL